MKRTAIFLLAIVLVPSLAFGEIKTITHSVKQVFGGSQSPDDARAAGVARAKREALEMAGTYVRSTTVVRNSQVESDEVLAIAAGILKTKVVSEKNYATGEAFGIEMTVEVEVDTGILEANVKHMLAERSNLEQLKAANAREAELLKKVATLEEENLRIKGSPELREKFRDSTRGLIALANLQRALFNNESALRSYERGRALYESGLYPRQEYELNKVQYENALKELQDAQAAARSAGLY
jgi:hypothetical protein